MSACEPQQNREQMFPELWGVAEPTSAGSPFGWGRIEDEQCFPPSISPSPSSSLSLLFPLISAPFFKSCFLSNIEAENQGNAGLQTDLLPFVSKHQIALLRNEDTFHTRIALVQKAYVLPWRVVGRSTECSREIRNVFAKAKKIPSCFDKVFVTDKYCLLDTSVVPGWGKSVRCEAKRLFLPGSLDPPSLRSWNDSLVAF